MVAGDRRPPAASNIIESGSRRCGMSERMSSSAMSGVARAGTGALSGTLGRRLQPPGLASASSGRGRASRRDSRCRPSARDARRTALGASLQQRRSPRRVFRSQRPAIALVDVRCRRSSRRTGSGRGCAWAIRPGSSRLAAAAVEGRGPSPGCVVPARAESGLGRRGGGGHRFERSGDGKPSLVHVLSLLGAPGAGARQSFALRRRRTPAAERAD